MTGGWRADSAERPVMEGELQYHIRCGRGDVNRYVLLPSAKDRKSVV